MTTTTTTAPSTTSTTTTTTTAAPSDTTPPSAAIGSPTDGAAVAGGLVVTGSSSDNRAVARVEVRVDGGTWTLASGTGSWSLGVDTSAWAAGSSHTLGARAVDTSGNASAVAGITVQTATPPPGGGTTGDPSVAPATQGTWTSPEGVVIEVTTAGAFTIRDIYRLLLENATAPGDLGRIGPTLSIRLQDTYASSTST
ncbi:MAG: Ig-like domain-containing protein, partial [Acidimicrobiales bacterium]